MATQHASLAPSQQMTIEEFLAFTGSRPQEERWELIEGVAVLNPSPTKWHQIISLNIGAALHELATANKSKWIPALGVGTRVPVAPNSLPQPDVLVFEHADLIDDTPVTSDAIVLFEVLSKSNSKADQSWRRRVYSSIPNCQHYVTVSQHTIAVTRYDRISGWTAVEHVDLNSVLHLPALGKTAQLRLADIYRFTPLRKRSR